MIRWQLNSEFTRFLLTGGFAAAINFISRIGFSQFTSFRVAVILAYLAGMVTAFVLSKLFVFQPSGKHAAHEFFRFCMVNLLAIIQVWLISVGLVEYVFPALEFNVYPEEIAHLIGISVPVITSYYGHKHYSFAGCRHKSN